MIEMRGVRFAYPGGREIFRDFNWQVENGACRAVLGPSGGGKSTLLYLLAGLRFPTAGEVRVDGQALSRPRPQTGLILQDYGLLPWQTVWENITLGLRIREFYGPDGKHAPATPAETADARAWLERLGLSEVAQQYPANISGGQRQRTAIARTLVLRPDLLLMDEPFSSLDAVTRLDLQTLTLQLWRETRFTLVVVTHAIDEAAILGQRVLVLGKTADKPPVELENPCFGRVGPESGEFQEFCRELRARMEGA